MNNRGWEIVQDIYDANASNKFETLFTLSNGYRGLRGSSEFSRYGIRGNFIAGIFDKSAAEVTELVNAQYPLGFSIYADDEIINLDDCCIREYKRTLNMKESILYTEFVVETKSGRVFRMKCEMFVSKHHFHRWAAKYSFVSENSGCKIFIENTIDGTSLNNANNPYFTVKHYEVKKAADLKPGLVMKTVTYDKKIEIVEASALRIFSKTGSVAGDRKFSRYGERIREIFQIHVEKDREYTIEKYGTTFTSRDPGVDPFEACVQEINSFLCEGYSAEREAHKAVWNRLWENMDIRIEGDEKAQTGIRFNIFHLCACTYGSDDNISIAAKALHGEGYKGHVFWDTEIFMLPFFIYTQPGVAKTLLMYRYNKLEGARSNARINGFKGARFPWESADDGMEATPKWGFDYDGNHVRIWTGDEEYHINSDITYAIWEYFRATQDEAFLKNYGVEIFLDTSKFWQSRLEYSAERDRYEINRVIGPDEFHDHVDNNVYTNYLTKWSMKKSIELAKWLKHTDIEAYKNILNRLDISENDFEIWSVMQSKIFIPDCSNGSLIEQFDGYFKLKDIEITEYDENGIPFWPDLQGNKLCETQLVKQADVVMLMILLQEEFDFSTLKNNYDFYEKRTMHKSSLSPSMYSIAGLMVGDTKRSYSYFMKTLLTDLDDNQGNTDSGLHAASAGGSWQTAVFGFGGFGVDADGIPHLNPWIPNEWISMEFRINWRNAILTVLVARDGVTVSSTLPVIFRIFGKEYSISGNERIFSVK